jgi:hypothetical protein
MDAARDDTKYEEYERVYYILHNGEQKNSQRPCNYFLKKKYWFNNKHCTQVLTTKFDLVMKNLHNIHKILYLTFY